MSKPQMKRDIIANLRHDLDGSLDDAIALLQRHKAEAEAKGYTALEIDIYVYDEYGSPAVDVELFGNRMETDQETESRERLAAHAAQQAEQYARLQYEQLKAKFG